MKKLVLCGVCITGAAAFTVVGRNAFPAAFRFSQRRLSQSYTLVPSRTRWHHWVLTDTMNANNEFISSIGPELTRSEAQKLTVPQLKQQLRLRGLKVSGRKTELVERLLAFSETVTQEVEAQVVEADVVDKDQVPKQSKARRFAKEKGKELIDVTAYLDDDEKSKQVKSFSSEEESAEKPDEDNSSNSAEVWGSQAKIVDDYEGRAVVVDNLSRTVVEFIGSNQTAVKAYVVASRDALKAFLAGGEKGKNETSSAEVRLREIQTKREAAAKVPVRSLEEDAGAEEGDETGIYSNIIERDFSDWGKFTQTGAQLSASEVQGVLLLSDVYGAFTDDTRALAEKIAFECQPVVVMIPDVFREDAWKEEAATPGLDAEGRNYEQWRETHPDLRVNIDIRAAAACLRERYGVSSVVVWGTCYGGGRALEAASGYFPNGIVHDVDGRIGPPPVNPLAAVAWYPTRYDAELLFGEKDKRHRTIVNEGNRTVAIMSIFAGKDKIDGATPNDAAKLKSVLEVDERVNDHMVKVFPGQEHGFAHMGLGRQAVDDNDFDRFVDEEFGGSGQVSIDGGDAEVACLLSTAWMETYSRIFLPTTGPAVSKDKNEAEWSRLEMKDISDVNTRDIRQEIEDSLDNFVEQPLSGRSIDQTDEAQAEELKKILSGMQNGEELGDLRINPDDDLTTVYAKLKASDENFQIF